MARETGEREQVGRVTGRQEQEEACSSCPGGQTRLQEQLHLLPSHSLAGSRAQEYLAVLWDLSQEHPHWAGSNLCWTAQSEAFSRQEHRQGDLWCSSSILRQVWRQGFY